ncbi:MAG: YopX family protein [Clostridia bacterium]
MREILFRGKRVDNSEWVEGDFASPHNIVWTERGFDEALQREEMIVYDEAVDPETVGQFTGLTDKNGKFIFEGDIVRYSPNLSNMGKALDTVGTIVWHECGMFVISGHSYWNIGHIFNSECKEWADIIGNIHDNPELLEVEE